MSEPTTREQPFHMHRGVRFQSIAVSPADSDTPLQFVCFFDHTQNAAMAGGTAAVDAKFAGAIGGLRGEDHFRGEPLETLMLTPMHGQIPAGRLMLIGLGDPQHLSARLLRSVGRLAVREAIKLGVPGFSFAPSIKDAGVGGFAAEDVSTALAEGMMAAIASAQALVERGLMPRIGLDWVVFLAGPQHLADSQAGLRAALAASG